VVKVEKENQGDEDADQKAASDNAKVKAHKKSETGKAVDVSEQESQKKGQPIAEKKVSKKASKAASKPIEAVIVDSDAEEVSKMVVDPGAAGSLEKPKIELPPHPPPAPEVTVAVEEGTVVEVVQRERTLSQTAPPYTMPRPHSGSPDSSPCDEGGDAPEPAYEDEARKDVITSVQNMLKPHEGFLTRAQLVQASRELRRVTPYNFEAWRLHADVLLNALKQLETRQIQPDENFRILTIPLREAEIRDAAEAALRQCAHYAESEEKRIALIDEANSVRRKTWF